MNLWNYVLIAGCVILVVTYVLDAYYYVLNLSTVIPFFGSTTCFPDGTCATEQNPFWIIMLVCGGDLSVFGFVGSIIKWRKASDGYFFPLAAIVVIGTVYLLWSGTQPIVGRPAISH